MVRDPETAARLPSALFGAFALPIFAAFVWLIAGPWAALVATFMLAVYPEAVRQSRTAGLYSMQHFFGVIALCSGWLATSRAGPRQSSDPIDLVRRWVWSGVCLLSLLIAGSAHLSAATVVAAFGIWMLFLAVAAFWLNGASTVKNNLAVQLVIIGAIGCIAIFLVRPDVLAAIKDKITAVPNVALATASIEAREPWFYVFHIASQFAWAFTLLPLLVLVGLRRNTWLTIYLTLWLVVPILVHSLFIARKEERLILIALPALFFLAGLAVHEGRTWLVDTVNLHAREWLATYRSAVRTGYATAWLVLVFALLTLPALVISLRIPGLLRLPAKADWTALQRVFRESAGSDNLPLGSDVPLASLLYLGRVDFAVAATGEPMPRAEAANMRAGRFRATTDTLPREGSSSALLTPTLARLRDAYLPYGDVHLVLDSRALESVVIEQSLRQALYDNATELCQARCGTLRLYRLRLTD
jgi:hypothetical protein